MEEKKDDASFLPAAAGQVLVQIYLFYQEKSFVMFWSKTLKTIVDSTQPPHPPWPP